MTMPDNKDLFIHFPFLVLPVLFTIQMLCPNILNAIVGSTSYSAFSTCSGFLTHGTEAIKQIGTTWYTGVRQDSGVGVGWGGS